MIRQRFLTSCMTTVFLCGFAQAVAAAEINAPAGAWVVGPIAAKSDSGSGYCSMKNSFQNGQKLVFARDTNGVNSIALDFQQGLLEVGRQYSVTVNVGTIARDVTALAATTQVMIMPMGADKTFYDMLGRKEALSFKVSGTEYVFGLNGTAEALKTLGDCSAGLKSGAVVAQTAVPAVKTATAEPKPRKKTARAKKRQAAPIVAAAPVNRKLEQELESLRTQNEKLMAENHKIQALLLQKQQQPSLPPPPVQAPLRAEMHDPAPLNDTNHKVSLVDDVIWEENPQQQPQHIPTAEQDAARAENLRLEEESRRMAEAQALLQKPARPEDIIISEESSPEQPLQEVQAEETKTEPLSLKAGPAALAEELHGVETVPQSDIIAAADNAPVTRDLPGSLRKLLEASRIADGVIEEKDDRSMSWVSDDIYGAAHELSEVSGRSLNEMADSYIKQAASRCKGDFAQTMGDVRQAGNFEMLEAEMTCLDGKNNVAAAMLFVADQGRYSVITQEGSAEQMPAVLSKRDSIVSAASGSATN